ncbi:MAG: prepilin-type N-terminal cleavage/methylation domain-containing protein, partial [Planctomycetota bacterium]
MPTFIFPAHPLRVPTRTHSFLQDTSMNSCPRRRRNVRAFTLVELLVVTGIIAVLIAVLVPALISARNASRAAVCMSNIKQLATAHTMYLAENRGYFIQPGLGHSSSTTSA